MHRILPWLQQWIFYTRTDRIEQSKTCQVWRWIERRCYHAVRFLLYIGVKRPRTRLVGLLA